MSVLKNSVNKTVNHSLSITYLNSDSSLAVISLSAVSSSSKFLICLQLFEALHYRHHSFKMNNSIPTLM